MAKITDAQMQVLINCIGAVETGGQIYGQRRYDAYAGPYTNSSLEDSITIGAFQEFRENAKALLKDIKAEDSSLFAKYDTVGIAHDLEKSTWSGYSPSSSKVSVIKKIISSDVGKKVQDRRIVKLLNSYISYAESLGVTDIAGLFMCANFIHQGGTGAAKRVIGKTKKPYNLTNIYNATLTDTGNQVGAYRTRQAKMYEWLGKYLKVEEVSSTPKVSYTESELRALPVNWLYQFKGCSEGDSRHKTVINTFNNSRLSTRYTMTIYDAWCATGVSAAFIGSGLAGKPGSGSLFECCECSCPEMISLAKKQGIWVERDDYIPKMGDVIMYDWQDSGSGDNVGTADHVGLVVSVSGSKIKVVEANYHDSVADDRTLYVNGRYIRGYITPNYAKFAGKVDKVSDVLVPVTSKAVFKMEFNRELKKGMSGTDVKVLQVMLRGKSYRDSNGKVLERDGEFGANTEYALKQFQKKNSLTVDGVAGTKTLSKLFS